MLVPQICEHRASERLEVEVDVLGARLREAADDERGALLHGVEGVRAGADRGGRDVVEAHLRHRAEALELDERLEELHELQAQLFALLREAVRRGGGQAAAAAAALRFGEAVANAWHHARKQLRGDVRLARLRRPARDEGDGAFAALLDAIRKELEQQRQKRFAKVELRSLTIRRLEQRLLQPLYRSRPRRLVSIRKAVEVALVRPNESGHYYSIEIQLP